MTEFLPNVLVVLRPTVGMRSHVVLSPMVTSSHVALRPTVGSSNHVVLRPTAGMSRHVVLEPTRTSSHVRLRPTTTIVVSNRAFLHNLLISHRPIQMAIIIVTNLHAHVLSFPYPRINKRMVTKCIKCHALTAFVTMTNALKEKLTLTRRRRMKGRQGRSRSELVVIVLLSTS